MATAYVDPQTVHNPATGTVAPAAWGDVLRDDLEAHEDPAQCSVYHNTTQSITTGTLTALSANSENYDTDTLHSTVTNNSRVTIQKAGRYDFNVTMSFVANATGSRFVEFYLNGATRYEVLNVGNSGATQGTVLSGSRTITCIVGDYVEVRCLQDSGGNLNATNVEYRARRSSR